MRSPSFGQLEERPTRWGPGLIVWSLREYERREGRRLVSNDLGRALPSYLPSHEAIRKHFGTFAKACEAAYGESRPQGGNREDALDADTELALAELAEGKTLTAVAAKRGITGQALGRRLRRYQASHGLEIVKRQPGRPANAGTDA